ncbi:hypothetical protein MESS4_430074 [Mesorhizobium sp. STM 4661]|nr:hypothetical protein MESS4_430074 [Mesorhizobium sp. STM 4661]
MQWQNPEHRPSYRKYTVRALDVQKATLDIDFVLHADAGPGSAFAETARSGDRVGVVGPGGGGHDGGGLASFRRRRNGAAGDCPDA